MFGGKILFQLLFDLKPFCIFFFSRKKVSWKGTGITIAATATATPALART